MSTESSTAEDRGPASARPRDPVIEAYKKDVDRTLLRENLKLTVQQRVDKMIAALELAEAVRGSRTAGS